MSASNDPDKIGKPERLAFARVSSAHLVAVRPSLLAKEKNVSDEVLQERASVYVFQKLMEDGVNISGLTPDDLRAMIKERIPEEFAVLQERGWLTKLLEDGPQSAQRAILGKDIPPSNRHR